MSATKNVSTLQNELIQTTNDLSEDGLRAVIEMVRTIIIPYDAKVMAAKNKSAQKPEHRIGSRKGVTFIANGHDIDDYNDEIEMLFGVNEE